MLFNSYVFVGFFLIVYGLYLGLRRHGKAQNILLLIASYIFYGYWDWRFLFLIFLSTLVDFQLAKGIQGAPDPSRRKFFLALSVIFNLTLLGFFKYFDFFSENFLRVLNLFGLRPDFPVLHILLPVGISFYTFQEMGYVIDVYRRDLKAADSLLDFALFVSFFPQLVAGPIERAVNLLPQVSSPRTLKLEQIHAGIFLILWGYFKKIVIADNLGMIADLIFNGYRQFQGVDILIGALAFTFQIYCDFGGYSDIGRGLAKLMGFELMVNFKLPYFALNPKDFWSRWHISLSSWFRDYLYIPLGGNRKGAFNTCRNLALTVLLAGLWHGASWNFILWGGFHAGLLIFYRLFHSWRGSGPSGAEITRLPLRGAKMFLMFMLTVAGWVIFRSQSIDQTLYFFTHAGLTFSGRSLHWGYGLLFFITPLLIVQVCQHFSRDLLVLAKLKWWARVPVFGFLLAWILIFGVRQSVEFIYFQF